MKNISIVTISYNQIGHLTECVRSVLSQLKDGDEYIIVDPGSTDGSREKILQLKNNNVQTIFEPDIGPADGLNKGFAKATGEIFFYLNSDDILLPGALDCARAMFENSSVDVLMGNGCIVDAQSRMTDLVLADRKFATYKYLTGASIALQQATYIKADAFHAVGGFNSGNKTCWDGELLLDLKIAGYKFKHIDAFLGAFRIYDESITGSQRLRSAYLMDKRRMFYGALGRHVNLLDKIAGIIFRVRNKISRIFFKYKNRGINPFAPISIEIQGPKNQYDDVKT